jgi:hypothetical protein
MDASLTAAFREAMSPAPRRGDPGCAALRGCGQRFRHPARPGSVRRLASASWRLAAGHYAERVPRGDDDELGDLTMTFNEMAPALKTTERRRRRARAGHLSAAPWRSRPAASTRGRSIRAITRRGTVRRWRVLIACTTWEYKLHQQTVECGCNTLGSFVSQLRRGNLDDGAVRVLTDPFRCFSPP